MIGISIPAAPGFMGTWEYSTILALLIYNVSKNDALAFSLVYHLVGISTTIILGLIFLPFVRISFSDMKKIKLHDLKPID